MSGRFITLEGGEGAGKSTHSARLARWLEQRGHAVVATREPGGTVGADAVRALLMAGEADFTPRAEALLFAAARADHVERVIRPALAEGKWVVCDRFLDSSLAYQGAAGGLGIDTVRAINAEAVGGLVPDLTLLLRLGAREGAVRAAHRDGAAGDRFSRRDEAFHEAVAAAFDTLAAAEPQRFAVIDAAADVETVAAAIRETVERRL